jgi:hypothetical protein
MPYHDPASNSLEARAVGRSFREKHDGSVALVNFKKNIKVQGNSNHKIVLYMI